MMMMFKEKERRIVKVNFCLQKQDRGARNFTIENGEKEERKKERKKETLLTESCSEGAVRMSMLVAEDMMRDDVWYKKAFIFFWRLFVPKGFCLLSENESQSSSLF
tara:strand:- start:2339 stop:2656 length:318 start_codon:yes stop_codon:yes gene_type:complete